MNSIEWQWPDLNNTFQSVSIPSKYELAILDRNELSILVNKLQQWYSGIVFGEEVVHLDENFYLENAFLADSKDQKKNILPVILKHQEEIVALVTFEKNALSRNLTSRIGAVDPKHRGSGIAFIGPNLLETLGRQMNAGLIFYYATLQIPHQQIVAEKIGFMLVGIMPAFDRDIMKNGLIKRVYEAIYAKILCEDSDIEIPTPEALTPRTKKLFNIIYNKFKNETCEADKDF